MSSASDLAVQGRPIAGLTRTQAEAASLTGAVLVLAGAGTGKTSTLTTGVALRIAERGIPAARILAVTFTNKAAGEMRARIVALLGGQSAPSWIGTFHGLGARQLRLEPEMAGLRADFDVLDADDARRLLRRVMKAAGTEAGEDEIIGKEIADKIMAAEKETSLSGGDLKLGGEGMRAFYDKKRAEGKTHKQAVIALARRRLDTLYAMLRDGTFYQDPETIRSGTGHTLAA